MDTVYEGLHAVGQFHLLLLLMVGWDADSNGLPESGSARGSNSRWTQLSGDPEG